jgi:hypothetical protein
MSIQFIVKRVRAVVTTDEARKRADIRFAMNHKLTVVVNDPFASLLDRCGCSKDNEENKARKYFITELFKK